MDSEKWWEAVVISENEIIPKSAPPTHLKRPLAGRGIDLVIVHLHGPVVHINVMLGTAFEMTPPYPNPFNPQTQFPVTWPKAVEERLTAARKAPHSGK